MCIIPRKIFDFDIRKLRIEDVIDMVGLGTRRHLLKMDDSTIPKANENARKLRNIDIAVKTALILILTTAAVEAGRNEFENYSYFETSRPNIQG